MKNNIRTLKKTIPFLSLLISAMMMFQSCEKNATGIKTITGVVKSIESHEEGYVVDILGNNGFTYKALVSLSNLKKQDVYRAYNIGNKISVKGEIWQLNNTYHITVKRIKE